MSQKDLEKQFQHLATEFKELKSLTEKLYKKYELLENKYEKCLKKKANASFKCKVCDQECENIKDLQGHKREKHADGNIFKCDDCEKVFKSETKQKEHEKIHTKY